MFAQLCVTCFEQWHTIEGFRMRQKRIDARRKNESAARDELDLFDRKIARPDGGASDEGSDDAAGGPDAAAADGEAASKRKPRVETVTLRDLTKSKLQRAGDENDAKSAPPSAPQATSSSGRPSRSKS